VDPLRRMNIGHYDCFPAGPDLWDVLVVALLLCATLRLGYTALRRRSPPHSASALRLGSRRRRGGASA
jgi:hypothetical protein